MENNYGSRKSGESISTLFSKIQLQEDVNFSHDSRVLTSFTLLPLFLPLLTFFISDPFLLLVLLLHTPHQLLLFPTSFFSSTPDLQRISSTFLAKNLGRSVVEIKQTLFSAFPTFSQSFFRAPPLSLIAQIENTSNLIV